MSREPEFLVAVAAELEKEGQYNTAKLVRAAAISTVNRRSFAMSVPSEPSAQANLLEELAGQLAGTPAAALTDPLRRAATALRAGGVALAEDAPDPYVCRVCGEVKVGSFDERCSSCGRWPTAAERVRAIYWMRESTPAEAIKRLRRTAQEVQDLLEGRSRQELAQKPPAGGWSAHQTLEHLNNAQGIFRGRIDQLLAGGEPALRSVMVWRMEGADHSTHELFDAYRDLRAEILEVLETAPLGAFENRGSHEEWGWVTLGEQTSYFANHEPTHLAQIADALGGGDV